MITSAYQKCFMYASKPIAKALNLRDASIEDNGTWGEALTARALFIAQAIVSLVAIPFTFLALLFAPALALCVEGKKAAGKLLKDLSGATLLNISFIPTGLISAFVPHSLEWKAPTLQVVKCLNKCLR
jgi:hypothetical protein